MRGVSIWRDLCQINEAVTVSLGPAVPRRQHRGGVSGQPPGDMIEFVGVLWHLLPRVARCLHVPYYAPALYKGNNHYCSIFLFVCRAHTLPLLI